MTEITYYFVIEIEGNKGKIVCQTYSEGEAEKQVKFSNTRRHNKNSQQHIYLPVRISSFSLSTPSKIVTHEKKSTKKGK
jgi:hypothetical protein